MMGASMIRRFVLCLALMLSGPVAHAAYDCDPLAVNGGVQIGTAARTVTSAAGSSDVWWCQYTTPSTPTGMVQWWMQRPVYLKDCRDATRLVAAIGRIGAAGTNMFQQLETEVREGAKSCIVEPDSRRHYDVQYLRWLGCRELALNPPPNTPATWLKPASASDTWKPVDWCGPEPVAPAVVITPPAGVLYVVTATQAFPLKPDGSRSLTAWPTPPIRGETCDCTVQIPNPFSGRYCKVPRLSSAQTTVVAGCSAKQ